MFQTRLNRVMILSVNKEYIDRVDLVDIGNEFLENHITEKKILLHF